MISVPTGGMTPGGQPIALTGPSALTGGGGVNMGMPAPTPENTKQAYFASTMLSSLKTMRGLENQGIALTPTQRAQVIKIATGEGTGGLSQWMQQEALKHNLNANAQTYLAAMMPMIQAVSHDQSGARLNEGQIKTNLESVIPVDVKNAEAMKQINSTRDEALKSMAIGAGSAAYTPEYSGTIGAFRNQQRAAANLQTLTPEQARSAPKGTRFRTTDGRIMVVK